MMRFIMPIILVGISVSLFFVFGSPLYQEVSDLRAQIISYDEALTNAKALENERDKLTAKFNSLDPENLAKLKKLLPENVDNVRLTLEIEQLATPYGMALKDVKYSNPENSVTNPTGAVQGGGVGPAKSARKDYGI